MMYSSKSRSLLFVLVGFVGLSTASNGQPGSIAGTVVDAETGETLIGANVIIERTTIGSTTDLDGQYKIKTVEPGSHNLVFSYIGYQSRTVGNVEVRGTRRRESTSP